MTLNNRMYGISYVNHKKSTTRGKSLNQKSFRFFRKKQNISSATRTSKLKLYKIFKTISTISAPRFSCYSR